MSFEVFASSNLLSRHECFPGIISAFSRRHASPHIRSISFVGVLFASL